MGEIICYDLRNKRRINRLYQGDKNFTIVVEGLPVNPVPVFQYTNRNRSITIDRVPTVVRSVFSTFPDVNHNGIIDDEDAEFVLEAAARVGLGLDSGLSPNEEKLADTTCDNELTSRDAYFLKDFIAYVNDGRYENTPSGWMTYVEDTFPGREFPNDSALVSTIPDELLREGEPLSIFFYVKNEDGSKRTIGSVHIPVRPRMRPDDAAAIISAFYVTFLSEDGTHEYGNELIISGNDAADPISVGLIDTPTKETSYSWDGDFVTQSDYYFDGWSFEPNGDKEDFPFSSIIADRDLYAHFSVITSRYVLPFPDVNHNGVIDSDDAGIVLEAAAEIGSDLPISITDEQMVMSELDCDGIVTAEDAYILYDFVDAVESGRYDNNPVGWYYYSKDTNPDKRFHRVDFYNGDHVVTIKGVLDGDSVVYPRRACVVSHPNDPEGKVFVGWDPLPENVESDLVCNAQFVDTITEAAVVSEITDSWEDIISSTKDGSYRTKYTIGNYKELDLGSEGVVKMQLVAKDADYIPYQIGVAATTWVSMDLLNVERSFNPTLKSSLDENNDKRYETGSGVVGGWEFSEIRKHLYDNILPSLPEGLSDSLRYVAKTSLVFNERGDYYTTVSYDKLWIPSHREVFGTKGLACEDAGCVYGSVYNSDETRKKALSWHLRSAQATTEPSSNFCVSQDGTAAPQNSSTLCGISIGFCI